jgi:hypothetical protein
MFPLNRYRQQGTPSIECPDGKWMQVDESSLQSIGICAGDLVCVVPAAEWPNRGPVLIHEDGIDKLGYCKIDQSGNIDIDLGNGSTLHWIAAIHSAHLLGWVVRVTRYYKDPPLSQPLQLVEKRQRSTMVHKGACSANGTKPHGLNLHR